MALDHQSPSPSRIPSFSPTPSEVSSSASLKAAAPAASSSPADIVKQLLDELISSAALLAAEDAVQTPSSKAKLDVEDSSRASGAGRSAITALREGIDAKSHEPASIEAMEALCSTGGDDSLLVPSSQQQQRSNQGTTLQELADMCGSADFGSLEAEGPAGSWLRASSDLSAPASATGTAATAGASSAPDLALNMHGPSWDEFMSDMGTKLHTSACHAPLVLAAEAAAQGPAAAAAVRTAPAALGAAAYSSSSRQGAIKAAATAAASRDGKGGSYAAAAVAAAAGSPKGAAGAGRSGSPAGGYALARTPVRNSPRSPTPSGKPGAVPRSPGSAALVPAHMRTRIPQQQQPQGLGLDRSDSFSRSGSSRIPSALSPPPAAQPAPVVMQAAAAGGGALNPSKGTGLDDLLSGTRRRSSSDNGSSASSRKGSVGGSSGPRDEASAAWMSSLRSGGPSSLNGSRKAVSRSSSTAAAAAATPPLSTRSSSKQLHSIRSGRTPGPALDPAPAAAAVMTPPAGIRSTRSIRTTPRSSIDSSSGKHAHLSLRRSGSLRSVSDSPTAAAVRSSSGRVLSPYTEAVPLPLAFEAAAAAAAAAAEIPEGCEAPVVSGAGMSRGLPHSSVHSSVDGAGVGHLAADACIESWLQPGRAAAPSGGATGSLASMGGASSLLSSDGEIMADPTAVRLFMELNEEIEAEGKAAMAAASAAAKMAAAASPPSAAAAAAEPAAVAVAVSAPAAVEMDSEAAGTQVAGVSSSRRTSSRGASGQLAEEACRRVSSSGASGQLAGEASGMVQQPVDEASWGSGGANDLRHSVSPESQGVQRTSQSDAEPAAAAVAAAAGPAADELRVSNTVDTRLSASHEAPVALTSKAEGAEGVDGSAAAAVAAVSAAAAAPAHAPAGELSQQASSQGVSDADAEADAHDEQPSCSCNCVIM